MRVIVLGIATCLLGASVAHGQGLNLQVQRIGNQVITDVAEVIRPPLSVQAPGQGKADAGGASATATVLNVKEWQCGGLILIDDEGRRWRLVNGLPITTKDKQLSGWRLVPTEGERRFFTTTGRLYLRQ